MENKEKNTPEIQTKAELFEDTFLKAAAFFMAVIVAFSVIKIGADSGKNMKPTVIYSSSESTNTVNNNKNLNSNDGSDETTDNSGTANVTNTVDGTENNNTQKPANNGEKTTAEIVALYNESVNKVKKESTSLTRNYKKMSSLDEYLELPSAIEGLGKTAMNTFVKGSDTPETWTDKNDIKTIFPVGGEDYSSKLTPQMVKKATCKETENAYEINIILDDDTIVSPQKGQGYAGVFNTVTAATFEGINIPTVTFNSVDVKGINGSIK